MSLIEVKFGGQTHTIDKDRDFLAAGGQAELFVKGGKVVKLYFDPKTMPPEKKLTELGLLARNKAFVIPQEFVKQGKKNVGLLFDLVKDCVPLQSANSNGFWVDNGITPKSALEVVEKIKANIQFAHEQKCLIVDLNPFNVLLGKKDQARNWFIDTESYATPNFKATAIAPGIRDWQAKEFTALTDWYSFAIIACEFFLGAHPFRNGSGRHPDFPVKPDPMEERMRKNVSVFNKRTQVSSKIRSLDAIPQTYREWFIALFECGKRTMPPDIAVAQATRVIAPVIRDSASFMIELLQSYPEDIRKHKFLRGKRIVKAGGKTWVGKVAYDQVGEVILFEGEPLFASLEESGRLRLVHKLQPVAFDLLVDAVLVSDNQLYAKINDNLVEIEFSNIGGKIVATTGSAWPVMPYATKLFSNILTQNILGRIFFLIPGYANVHIKELAGHEIENATRTGSVIFAVSRKGRKLWRSVIVCSGDYSSYKIEAEETDDTDINAAKLLRPLLVQLTDEMQFEIADLKSGQKRIVNDQDNALSGQMRISSEEDQLVFFVEKQLFKISMK